MKLDTSDLRYLLALRRQLQRRRAVRAVMIWLALPAGILVTIGVIGQYLPAEAAMYTWLALTVGVIVGSGGASGPLADDTRLGALLDQVMASDPANRDEAERVARLMAGRSRLDDLLNRPES